jgi:hypothetical protein
LLTCDAKALCGLAPPNLPAVRHAPQ